MIIAMIHILYKLDAYCKHDTDEHSVILTKESLLKIRDLTRDFTNKIQCIKAHMKDSLYLLNGIQLDLLEKMLTYNETCEQPSVTTTTEVHCSTCGKKFKNANGLKRHACKLQLQENISEIQ